jgi:phosphoribosylanthranilate isomerase
MTSDAKASIPSSAFGLQPSLVRVKVCGITTPGDALECASAGADWIGLNFHPPSPRWIDPGAAAAIVARLPATTQAVGLFVDRAPCEVVAMATRVGVRIVQLHGDEPPEDLPQLEGLLIVRAFRLSDAASVVRMDAYLERAAYLGRAPDAVLVDTYVPGVPGGTGRSIPTDILDRLPALPHLILAGGLTPENVAERVARVRPWMVDVAGGVESAPGRKDLDRVIAFIRAVRGNNQSGRTPSIA